MISVYIVSNIKKPSRIKFLMLRIGRFYDIMHRCGLYCGVVTSGTSVFEAEGLGTICARYSAS